MLASATFEALMALEADRGRSDALSAEPSRAEPVTAALIKGFMERVRRASQVDALPLVAPGCAANGRMAAWEIAELKGENLCALAARV